MPDYRKRMRPPRPFASPDRVVQATHLAARHCPLSGADCGWYHGAWPLWRALGLASTPALHEVFYEDAIAEHLQAGGGEEVLITGAADPAMLATTVRAFAECDREPRLTVLDRCDTPLHLAQEWADEEGFEVRAIRADVLDDREIGAFDLVCTHAFLGYFGPPARARLAARWRKLLVPGGRVVTLNRLRPTAPTAPIGFTPVEAALFIERAQREANARHWDVEDAVARARVWTARFRQWPVRSAEEVVALLRGAGFRVTTRAVLNPAAADAPTGPGTPGGALFAGFIAVAAPDEDGP